MKKHRLILPLLALTLTASVAHAQYQDDRYQPQQRSGGGFLDGLFGGSERMRQPEPPRQRPPRQERYQEQDEGDLAVEVDRLRNRVRQLTGQVEELEHRNRQLEQQVQSQGGAPAAPRAEAPRQIPPSQPSSGQLPPPGEPAPPLRQSHNESNAPSGPTGSVAGRRGDAFDPDANPSAPGLPKALGSPDSRAPQPVAATEPPRGREHGEPLDIGQQGQPAAEPPRREARTIAGPLPAPGQRGANGAQPQPVSAPAATSRDAFAAAQGQMQRREYAQAETSLREFLKKYPGDRLAGDAHYQLGESFYQRQNYREAAESFLTVQTKYGKIGKAPDALLRLGQSLAALGEKDAACATLSEVSRKYPNANSGVKQNVERERTRAKCS